MKMTKNQDKSIALLSGGLDSLVSLGFLKKDFNIDFALTFDYGQKAAKKEIEASKRIAEYYEIDHKVIKLEWLREITSTSLVNKDEKIPEVAESMLDNYDIVQKSAQNVWVPNRNGIFINIAAGFADSMGFKYIIFGANKEEAATFSDNSEQFIKKINKSLEYSTLTKSEVIAPFSGYTKKKIVKIAKENNIPLHLLRSCYEEGEKHCGKCESCTRLKKALHQVFKELLPVEFEC